MKGFDPKFRDFPDYIIGITKEIWEDRGSPRCMSITAMTSSSVRLVRLFWAIRMSLGPQWQRLPSFRIGSCWAKT